MGSLPSGSLHSSGGASRSFLSCGRVIPGRSLGLTRLGPAIGAGRGEGGAREATGAGSSGAQSTPSAAAPIVELCPSPPQALQSCLQEQQRLKDQLRVLEAQVKWQQVWIEQLLREQELQLLDRGAEKSIPPVGGKRQYADCSEIFNDGHRLSGFYRIKPLQSPEGFSVYCDMEDGGGWTVVQRRWDGSENFNRNWEDYEKGFGNFVQKNGEYWLGNKNLHFLTTQCDYTLKIDLADFEGEHRFAQYESFRVGDEKSAYELSFREYSGTAGDSLSGSFHPEVQWWASHLRMKFSTQDRDNDNYSGNCAKEDKAGWWYNRCHSANLNGLYYKGAYKGETDNGIVWYTWHGWWYSLKSVVMKIRPSDFVPNIL